MQGRHARSQLQWLTCGSHRGQIGAQAAGHDRRKYGPFLLCLPAEPLAVITLHVVLSALLAGGKTAPAAGLPEGESGREAGSARVTPLVLQIGRARPAAATDPECIASAPFCACFYLTELKTNCEAAKCDLDW